MPCTSCVASSILIKNVIICWNYYKSSWKCISCSETRDPKFLGRQGLIFLFLIPYAYVHIFHIKGITIPFVIVFFNYYCYCCCYYYLIFSNPVVINLGQYITTFHIFLTVLFKQKSKIMHPNFLKVRFLLAYTIQDAQIEENKSNGFGECLLTKDYTWINLYI